MSESIIGKVGVNVYPNTKSFRAKLKEDLETIERSIDEVNVDLEADAKGLLADVNKSVKAVSKTADDIDVKVRADEDDLNKSLKQLNKDHKLAIKMDVDRTHQKELISRVERDLSKIKFRPKFDKQASAAVLREMEDLLLKRDDLNLQIGAEFDLLKKRELIRSLGDVDESIVNIQRSTRQVNRELGKWHIGIDKAARAGNKFPDIVGRAFGKGSRNNGLNFLGGRMASLAVLIAAPIAAVATLGSAITGAIDQFKNLTEAGVSTGKALISSIGGGIAAASQSFVSLGAAALGAIVVLASLAVVVPIVTMLAGAIIALAGSITIALIGAILPLVPLLAGLALGFGVAAAAFVPLVEDIKKGTGHFAGAKKQIDKLKTSVTDLSKAAAPAIGRLATTFTKGADSLVKAFGPAVKRVFDDLDKKLRSPAMDEFYDMWNTSLPRVFESFSKGVSSLGTALVAFFTPILPYAEQLADSFKLNMDRFTKWAQSAEGQNSIAEFMEKAKDRADKLWNIIKDIGAGFWNMMTVGDEKAGNDILSYMEKVSAKFKEWTKKPLEMSDFVNTKVDAGTLKASGVPGINRNESSGLEKFMEDVKAFSKEIKDAGVELGKFFDELNKPENRANATSLADSIGKLAQSLSTLAFFSSGALGPIMMLQAALKGDLKVNWDKLVPDIGSLIPRITMFVVTFVATIIDGIGSGLQAGLLSIPLLVASTVILIPMAIINGIKAALGIHSPSTVMIALMADVGAGIVQGLLAIPAQILGALLAVGEAIVNAFKGIPEKVKSVLSPLGSNISSAINTAKGMAGTAMSSLVSSGVNIAKGLPSKVKSGISPLGSLIGGVVKSAQSTSNTHFAGLVSSGVNIAKGLPSGVKSAISSLGSQVSGVVKGAWNSATSATRAGVGATAAASAALTGAVVAQTSGMASRMASVGADIVNGLVAGIAANAGRAAIAAANMAANALYAAKAALASRSPSKKFIRLGKDSGTGLAMGLKASTKKVNKAATSLAGKAFKLTADKGKKAAYQAIYEQGRSLMTAMRGGMKNNSGKVKSLITDLTKSIRQMGNVTARHQAEGMLKNLNAKRGTWERLNRQYEEWVTNVQNLRKEKEAFATSMVTNAVSIAGLGNIEGGFAEVLHRLKTAKAMTAEFSKYLATLRKNGLRKDLYEEIANLGPEGGLAAAKAIAEAGKKGVTEVNKLQEGLLKTSSTVADASASYLYDSGINMATAIANGFRVQMKKVEMEMLNISKSLAKKINSQLGANGIKSQIGTSGSAAVQTKSYYPTVNSGSSKTLNYYAAPGSAQSDQQGLFKAFKKVGF